MAHTEWSTPYVSPTSLSRCSCSRCKTDLVLQTLLITQSVGHMLANHATLFVGLDGLYHPHLVLLAMYG